MNILSFKPRSKENVLIVEDSPSWQRGLKRYLRHTPFNVYSARDSQEALQLVKKHRFSLAIVDVNLSGVPYNVDGLQLAEQMAHKNKKLKVMLISGSQEWNRRLGTFKFKLTYIVEKQNLDQDDFVNKVYESIRNQ
jgi:DNA-binding response OmpR family regulator